MSLIASVIATTAMLASFLVPTSAFAGDTTWDPDESPNYYKVIGTAEKDYSVKDGETGYCDLDDLGRAGCAYASIDEAPTKTTGNLPDPKGWPSPNPKVTIQNLNNDKSYSGYMWNRSHLLADSLGGDEIVKNLITGTRTQNVGNSDQQGGMRYTEVMASGYLETGRATTCPLYYAATPVYQGNEPTPRAVTVDIQSCDKKIDERVLVYNTANGWDINYATAAISETSTSTDEPSSEPSETTSAGPTEEPSSEPTSEVSAEPTNGPTTDVTVDPSSEPSTEATTTPTSDPTTGETGAPSASPSSDASTPRESASATPSSDASVKPSASPSTTTNTSDKNLANTGTNVVIPVSLATVSLILGGSILAYRRRAVSAEA